MRKRPQGSAKPTTRLKNEIAQPGLPVNELAHYIPVFLAESEYRNHSKTTIQEEGSVLKKLLRYLQEEEAAFCGQQEIQQFLLVVRSGGMQRGGRWGQKKPQPVRPRTEQNYWGYLRTFFNWLEEEDSDFLSPMARVKKPIGRSDQIRPFSQEQTTLLFQAAKQTSNPLRDEAILSFLLDTGVRAEELCGIKVRDLDMSGHRCTVLGKGNKHRVVPYGRSTHKALWRYLQNSPKRDDDPLFTSARGKLAGDPLTRGGLLQLIERLGKSAGLRGVRCSTHTFRHTCAIRYLNNGANVFSLQQILGHTDLTMTQRYLNLAEADIESQSRLYSPVDSLKGRKRER